MTDKKLKELLIVIDNRYGRVRSKEDRIIDPPTCAIDGCILYEAPQSWCYVEERGRSE